MPNIDPKYFFWLVLAISLGTIAGVVALSMTGNKDQISTVVGVAAPILLALLGAKIQLAHQANVQVEQKVLGKVQEVKDEVSK